MAQNHSPSVDLQIINLAEVVASLNVAKVAAWVECNCASLGWAVVEAAQASEQRQSWTRHQKCDKQVLQLKNEK